MTPLYVAGLWRYPVKSLAGERLPHATLTADGVQGDRLVQVAATHELNSAILAVLSHHGIDIPFPQRDLHLKSWTAGLLGPKV